MGLVQLGGGMMLGRSRLLRDAYKSLTLTGNNQTLSQAVFTLTGVVKVYDIWGVVTTAIGANHTAGHLRLNDQTATLDITLNTGITLSSYQAGSLIFKEGLTAAALVAKRADVGFFEEPGAAGTPAMSPFTIGKKSGATTTIDYRYATTDAPTSGVIRWGALWIPLSEDGFLAAA